jgi:membrane protein DedA with SNARE-associated domain
VEDIGQLVAGLEGFVRQYGALAVLPILAIEAVGAPVPGETLLIFCVGAGRARRAFLVGHPNLRMDWLGVGRQSWLFDWQEAGRATILRYGTKVGLNEERLQSIEAIHGRYGATTVVFARFVSILRQLNGVMAGTLEMPWWRFLVLDALGAALWVTAWVFAAAYLTEHFSVIVQLAHHTKVITSLLVVAGLILVFRFCMRRLRVAGWTARR